MATLLTKILRRRVRTSGPSHGVKDELVVALYPSGVIGLRESRHKNELYTDLGSLYERLLAEQTYKRTETNRRRKARRGPLRP